MNAPLETVVVGNGMAAVRLVEELAARGVEGITVLGDEPHAPYNRILLSAVLEGTHSVDAITMRSPQWYADHGVELRLGARVLEVDRDSCEVMLVDGTRIALRPPRAGHRLDPDAAADPRARPSRRLIARAGARVPAPR